MRTLTYISILILCISSCHSQTEGRTNIHVGGPCEGCEAIYEYGNKALSPTDTLPKFLETEPKLKVIGTVFKKDGHTPAENTILYIYHTDRNGIYKSDENAKGWEKRHGSIRGWIKTGKDGKYTFYSFRPAAYPNGIEPEHIHITVKEPDKNEYYIDAFVFDDDPLLTSSERIELKGRGGSGILEIKKANGMLEAERDIFLGQNIPNYK